MQSAIFIVCEKANEEYRNLLKGAPKVSRPITILRIEVQVHRLAQAFQDAIVVQVERRAKI